MGIPKDMLASIFTPFTQVDRSLDRSRGGLGIGLTLVRRLVELHGGTVTAESDGLGQGSVFTICLPELPMPVSTVAPPTDDASPLVVNHRILVVDDNIDNADSLARLLRLYGHTVQVAYEGVSALSTAESFGPEVVLLDLGLPGLDGFEVARQLSARAVNPKALLIAISGYGQESDLRRSREAGFAHHLVKPVDLGLLTEALDSFGQSAEASHQRLLSN
jgi:two-component system CheB/CheR fusion protein